MKYENRTQLMDEIEGIFASHGRRFGRDENLVAYLFYIDEDVFICSAELKGQMIELAVHLPCPVSRYSSSGKIFIENIKREACSLYMYDIKIFHSIRSTILIEDFPVSPHSFERESFAAYLDAFLFLARKAYRHWLDDYKG